MGPPDNDPMDPRRRNRASNTLNDDKDFSARARALATERHGPRPSWAQLSQAGDDVRAEDKRRARAGNNRDNINDPLPDLPGTTPNIPPTTPPDDPHAPRPPSKETKPKEQDKDPGEPADLSKCDKCGGTGQIKGKGKCDKCGGTGELRPEEETNKKTNRASARGRAGVTRRADPRAVTSDELVRRVQADQMTHSAFEAEMARRRTLPTFRAKPFRSMTKFEQKYYFAPEARRYMGRSR